MEPKGRKKVKVLKTKKKKEQKKDPAV